MKIRINVGRIKIAMTVRGMTAEEAAEQMKISRGGFERILKEGQCAAFMLGRIGRLLDIPVWELVEK